MGSRAGLLTETPISIAATATSTPTAPPAGFAARISRLPDPLIDADHAQVVVEKYSAPGQVDRFQVYIGGTADFSPRAGGDAFDMTSNVSAMAGLPAGSYVAVERALADAGLRPADPVVFTGYSQGGLVASLLAASGDYNTHGIVTIGAPAGQVLLPHGIPAVVIEHTDDLVPALGGTQSNHDAVIVQRQAFGDRTVPNDIPVPAHHFEYYLETAQLLDNARSDQVTNAAQRLDAFGQDATSITSTRYFATRDPG
jgi:pimeloyl-ACP methyl ester carboxylesterase